MNPRSKSSGTRTVPARRANTFLQNQVDVLKVSLPVVHVYRFGGTVSWDPFLRKSASILIPYALLWDPFADAQV